MRRICPPRAAVSKKSSGTYTAAHAALGGRTLKTGQSRWFVGYKKHTLRLWLPTTHPSVTLVPLVSWITPANVAEGGLLRPSLYWCRQHLGWWPGIVVADMGYLSAGSKAAARVGWQCAVITKLRADMKLAPPYVNATCVACPQGQRLEWWEYEPESGHHQRQHQRPIRGGARQGEWQHQRPGKSRNQNQGGAVRRYSRV